MGNYWLGVAKPSLIAAEQKLLELADLPPESTVEIKNVYYSAEDYLHTVIIKQEQSSYKRE